MQLSRRSLVLVTSLLSCTTRTPSGGGSAPELPDVAVAVPDTASPIDPGPDEPAPPECTAESPCGAGSLCVSGDCVDPCSPEAARATGIGCSYFAVDLENSTFPAPGQTATAQDARFAVLLGNPSGSDPVTVTVHETVGGQVLAGYTFEIAAGQTAVAKLPSRNIAGTQLDLFAYVLLGNRPFEAAQVNPLDSIGAIFSNDVSRLLPSDAAGTEYLAVTGSHEAFVTVVGVHAGTEVSVRPNGAVAPGPGLAALEAGKLYTLALKPGEVLNLRAAGEDVDLTGTEIWSTEPVVVFSGSVASRTGQACCADHLEEQLPPVAAWGRTAVAARAAARGKAPDYWRIVAATDDTKVTFAPQVASSATLARGGWLEVSATESFVVSATEPVLVAHLLASSAEATTQGAYCVQDKECPAGQQCVGASPKLPGICRASCAPAQEDCPSAVYRCYDAPDLANAAGLPPGDGLCLRRRCGGAAGPCAFGTTCIEGAAAALCYAPCTEGETCAEPDGFCGLLDGQSVCAPGTCAGLCSGDAVCGSAFGGDPSCVARCKPKTTCPDAGFRCVSSELYPLGAVDFTGSVCLPPACAADADCPEGHLCRGGLCRPLGDPSMLVVPPVEQHTTQATVLIPEGYARTYVTIVAPFSASVLIDSQPVPKASFSTIAPGWRQVTMALGQGVHRIVGTEPIGVATYGYDDEVSFGTHAAMALVDLGAEPPPAPTPDTDPGDVSAPDAPAPETVTPPDVASGGPTWSGDVHPLLALRCVPCHIGGAKLGGANFDKYTAMSKPSQYCPGKTLGEAIAVKVGPTSSCNGSQMPLSGDKLDAAQQKLIADWVAAGMPE